jgi:histidinol phosphatase-like enzyme
MPKMLRNRLRQKLRELQSSKGSRIRKMLLLPAKRKRRSRGLQSSKQLRKRKIELWLKMLRKGKIELRLKKLRKRLKRRR